MKRWIWPALLVITIFLASSNNPVAPRGLAHFDKLVHFLLFGLIASVIMRCRTPTTWTWALITLLLVSGYGVLDELRQSFTPGRSVEWKDWLADTLGGLVAILLYKTVPFYSSILEAKVRTKTRPEEVAENNTVYER